MTSHMGSHIGSHMGSPAHLILHGNRNQKNTSRLGKARRIDRKRIIINRKLVVIVYSRLAQVSSPGNGIVGSCVTITYLLRKCGKIRSLE